MHICQVFLIELDPVKQYNEIITELTGGKIMNLGNSLLHARKKTRVITARCSGKAGSKPTDYFKMGDRRNDSRYSSM